MAFTSATRAIANARHQEKFTVERRSETVDDHGLSSISTREYKDVRGVITAGGDGVLTRGEAEQHMGKTFSIVTKFPLRGPARDRTGDYQPDVIRYRGDRFVVAQLDDYTAWGDGWVQALVESLDTVDAPPGRNEC